MNPAYWPFVFYVSGSLCFVVGSVLAMLRI